MSSLNKVIASSRSNVFRRVYIKRRSTTDGSFESDWVEVTEDVKSYGKVRQEIDAIRLSQLTFSPMKITFENDSGRYNPHDSEFSLWYGYLNQQRTLVKVEAGFVRRWKRDDGFYVNKEMPGQSLWDVDYWDEGADWDEDVDPAVFTGIISGDVLLSDRNEVSFNIQPLSSVFEDFPAEKLAGYTTGGMSASQFMTMLRDQTDGSSNFVFRPFFGDTTTNWDISATSVLYSLRTEGRDLAATSTAIDATEDTFISANHGYKTGQALAVTTTGTLPAGMEDTTYYAIANTSTHFQIADTADNAIAGLALDITDEGAGVLTFEPQSEFAVIGMTSWEVIEKLAQAENFVSYITADGKFKFVSRASSATTTVYQFHGAGSFDNDYGHTIKEVASFGLKASKYYSRVFLKWQDTDAIDASAKIESTFSVSPNSLPYVLGYRTLEIENTFVPNLDVATEIAQTIFDEYSSLKKEVEFRTSFVPHLGILDRCSIHYDPTEPSPGSIWDINDWAADDTETSLDFEWDGLRGEAMILRGEQFRFLSQDIDLDNFECRYVAREEI